MNLSNPDDSESRLLLEALVTYADACTMPRLTPSCPYYRLEDGSPACGEECRATAERYGVDSRPVHTALVDGLRLTGRALPLTAATGNSAFDAQRLYISERTRPPIDQSTTSLLLGLAAAIRPSPFDDAQRTDSRVQDNWNELARRGVAVERVLRGALVREMSEGIAVRIALPHLVELNVLPPYLSNNLISVLAQTQTGPWGDLLDHLVEYFGPGGDATAMVDRALSMPTMTSIAQFQTAQASMPWLDAETMDPEIISRVSGDRYLQTAFSFNFRGRVEEWVSRLMEEDLAAALRLDPAPPSVFLALTPARTTLDEVGLWLWERMTVTRLVDWSTSSLLLEWKMQRGEAVEDCSPRVLGERACPPGVVADLALERVSSRTGRRSQPRDLNPKYFTQRAAAELMAGNWETAASIFSGLVEIRPADGNAWNNLGFCLLASDPSMALLALERASLYEHDPPIINIINRCLAMHLLGRNEEAIALAESSIHLAALPTDPAILWVHDECGVPLVIHEHVEPGPYLKNLLGHLSPAPDPRQPG